MAGKKSGARKNVAAPGAGDDVRDDVPAPPLESTGGDKSPRNNKPEKKKEKKKNNKDDFGFDSQLGLAPPLGRRGAAARIKRRIMDGLLVGVIRQLGVAVRNVDRAALMKQAKAQKSPKERIMESWRFVQANMSALMACFAIFMLFYMKASQEGYYVAANEDGGESINPYQALGLSSSASQSEIKRAYKKLALQWHPDKHDKDCESCKKRFHEITVAFGKIGEEEKRRAFDANRKTQKEVLTDSASEKLTYDMWRNIVSKTNDVWIILFYDGTDATENIFPIFEELSLKHGNYVRYAHCDVSTADGLRTVAAFPQKFVLYPVVTRYSPSEYPEVWSPQVTPEMRARGVEGNRVKSIRKFIYETYPTYNLPYLGSQNLGSWVKQTTERKVLIVAPDASIIPSNTGLIPLEKSQWRGFSQKLPEPTADGVRLHPVESTLLFYKEALRFRGLPMGFTDKHSLLQHLTTVIEELKKSEESGTGGEDGSPDSQKNTAESVQKLARSIFLFFHLQQQWFNNKVQSAPYLLLSVGPGGVFLKTQFLPGKELAHNVDLIKRYTGIATAPRGHGAALQKHMLKFSRSKYLQTFQTFPETSNPSTISSILRDATHTAYLRTFLQTYLEGHELWKPSYGTCFDIYEATPIERFMQLEERGGSLTQASTPDDDDVRDAEQIIGEPEICRKQIPATRVQEFRMLLSESPEKANTFLLTQFLHDVSNEIVVAVDRSNYLDFCKLDGAMFSRTRNYCFLAAADKASGEARSRLVGDLLRGKEAYLKEVAGDGDDSAAEAGDREDFETRIQPVSYQPYDIVGAVRHLPVAKRFHNEVASRQELDGYDYLIVEADTSGVGAIRTKDVKVADVYAGLAFEDIRLTVEDFPNLANLLADTRVTFIEEIINLLMGSWLQMATTYVLAVLILSCLPEVQFFVRKSMLPLIFSGSALTACFSISYSLRRFCFQPLV